MFSKPNLLLPKRIDRRAAKIIDRSGCNFRIMLYDNEICIPKQYLHYIINVKDLLTEDHCMMLKLNTVKIVNDKSKSVAILDASPMSVQTQVMLPKEFEYSLVKKPGTISLKDCFYLTLYV